MKPFSWNIKPKTMEPDPHVISSKFSQKQRNLKFLNFDRRPKLQKNFSDFFSTLHICFKNARGIQKHSLPGAPSMV